VREKLGLYEVGLGEKLGLCGVGFCNASEQLEYWGTRRMATENQM
jgi:hypothetical protein